MNPETVAQSPLDPQRFPTYVFLALVVAISIGMIVFQFSGRLWLSMTTAAFLFIVDVVMLRRMMGRDK
ncbi:MAG: hypothetical protein K2Q12_05480 [Rickettsiales bacterium]|nr:hypothetical protein [Rickettsiales bacterium]